MSQSEQLSCLSDKNRSAPLNYQLAARLPLYADLEEFSLFLQARTPVPAERVLKWLDASSVELTQAKKGSQFFQSRFRTHLQKLLLETGGAGGGLGEMGAKSFSREHHWRAIFCALSSLASNADEFKMLAAEHYLVFVNNRLLLLNRLLGVEPMQAVCGMPAPTTEDFRAHTTFPMPPIR